MNQALLSSFKHQEISHCLHCGTQLAETEFSNFCCQGCSLVYAVLKERSLEDFYSLREKTASSDKIAPAHSVVEEFAYLDDPDFLKDYAFGEDQRQMLFYLEGVHCAACVWLTEKLPEFISGVESLRLNLASGVARVQLHKGGSFAAAAEEIAKLGYRPHPVKQGESDELRKKENRKYLIRMGIAAMASGNIMLLAAALYAGADGAFVNLFRWVSFILYLPVFFYSAIPFYQGSWASLRKKQISIDFPIVFGILVGTIASVINLFKGAEHIYFDSLAALIFLLLSTRYLLLKVNQHALSATQLIHQLAPSKARKKIQNLKSVP